MNKLIQGEAARIVAVLDETVVGLELLSCFPEREDIAELSGQLAECKSDAVLDAMHRLRDAEKRYIKAKRANSRTQAEAFIEGIHEATRKLCRELRRDPMAMQILNDWRQRALKQAQRRQADSRLESKDADSSENDDEPETRISLETGLLDLVKVLSGFKEIVLERLSTTVEQTQAREDFFSDVKLRIKQMEGDLQLLKDELKVEAEREVALQQKQDKITKLWNAIEEVRSSYDHEMAEIDSSGAEQKASVENSFFEKNKTAMDNFDKASQAFVDEYTSHGEREEVLRKKLNRATAEVNNIVTKYDAQMLERWAEYDRIKQLHTEESKRLAVLEEHFRKVDRDLANEAEEERLIAEELARIDALKQKDHNAAAKIQALFRGIQSRKKTKKKKKRGKGGKKGKKK